MSSTSQPKPSVSNPSRNTVGQRGVKKPAVQLPVELWLRIFYFNAYPLHLWNDGRRVCKLWWSWIPKIFAEKYIQDREMTSIQYDLGSLVTAGRSERLMLVMSFDRFDPTDRKRCIFTQDRAYLARNLPTQAAQTTRFNRWREVMAEYLGGALGAGGRPDLPPHIVMLKGRANDIELPGLQVDQDKHEISFEWHGMLQGFLREAAEYERRNEKGAGEKVLATAQRLMARDPERATEMLMSYYHANLGVRKQVRRERLKKQLRGWPGLDFTDETFVGREAHAIHAIAGCEGDADLTETAENADEIKRSAAADQDVLKLRALGFEDDGLWTVTFFPDFVELIRWWDEDDTQG
ncbi:hypothetical protein LTR36_007800 [Oleoguttula mirabilis]|uniref:F-box domain-containing protein n=1 Tax=Oleoguttula mirabilis TaxID=1507867 RepID=A0AAV9J9U0_9PEZI|nr:hypothetical protein LTR36_007800 [Oleoguttula mirabilis]